MRIARQLSLRDIVRSTIIALIATVALGVTALGSPVDRPPTAIANTATVGTASTTLGIADSDLYFAYNDPTAVAKHLDETAALGVHNVRLVVPWAAVEATKGQYTWGGVDNMVNAAAARGMGVLAVVTTTPTWARAANTSVYQPPTDPADFGAFVGTLAARYPSAVSSYEIWNEPNGAISYAPAPDPVGYTKLLAAAYPKIKAANSSAVVLGGVLGSVVTWGGFTLDPVDFVSQMYAAGAAGTFDALSFHPYQSSTKFSQGAALANSPLNQVNDIRSLMVSHGDSAKKIWATEYGLSTMQATAAQQADFIGDFVTTWRTLSYAGPAFVYTLVDRNSADTTDAESTFGVYTDSWAEKPAAAVVRSLTGANA
ncbi:cellulase family glycosylhydrolase [Williamsia sp. MIQD14]|uniref:cellulase family glycosylhydrolase n=1 Tax=Williamsia sp. MIQD14 TaxID=3425703 RepID=UPI003DA11302